MNRLVCITGLPGSGKSVASDYFVKNGFQFLRFGQITFEELDKKKLPVNEANERMIREGFRKKYGMAAYAILNLPKFKKLLKNGSVIGDGLYSFEEYKALKKEFGKRFLTIAIYSPPELRYERLTKRKLSKNDKAIRYRPLKLKEAVTRDLSEIENLNKGGTIAMADYTIVNTKSLQYFNKQLNEIYKEIASGKEIKKGE
jgi:dephospho-CoA kinase